MGKSKKPAEFSVEPLQLPAYQPIDYVGDAEAMLPTLEKYGRANISLQAEGQDKLTRGSFGLTKELAPQLSALRNDINKQYAPEMVDSLLGRINQADPEFLNVRRKLGERVGQGLDAGYTLGDELAREVEQSIRGAQTARGNWLGPAPTSEEAFAKASYGIDLYNQRLGAANQFLQSRGAGDLFGAYSASTDAFMQPNIITPQNQYIDAGIPAQIGASNAQNRNQYNNSMISAYGANLEGKAQAYDRQWDRYLYSSFKSGSGGLGGAGAPKTAGFGGAAVGAGTGMLARAAAGAIAGSVVPGVGTTAGAIAGGLFGALSGGMQGYGASSLEDAALGGALSGGMSGGSSAMGMRGSSAMKTRR